MACKKEKSTSACARVSISCLQIIVAIHNHRNLTIIEFLSTHVLQNKVEMMRDELAHKRELELAQVTKVPTASQPTPGKHNVPVREHNIVFICNCCATLVLLKCVGSHI